MEIKKHYVKIKILICSSIIQLLMQYLYGLKKIKEGVKAILWMFGIFTLKMMLLPSSINKVHSFKYYI